MARSNGTGVAPYRRRAMRAWAAMTFAGSTSCAALASWDGFSGGAIADAGGDSRMGDATLPDVRVQDAGGDVDAFVQVNAVATPKVMVQRVDVPYVQPQLGGDLNVVIVGWYDDATIDSVMDSEGNKYRSAVTPITIGATANDDLVTQTIFYASGIDAAAPNANVVTVLFNKSTASPDVRILEYRGLDKTDPLDGVASNSGRGAIAMSGLVTTRFASEVIVAGGTTGSGFSVAGPNFNLRIITEGSDIAEDRMVTTPGGYSTDVALQGSDTWVVQLASFH